MWWRLETARKKLRIRYRSVGSVHRERRERAPPRMECSWMLLEETDGGEGEEGEAAREAARTAATDELDGGGTRQCMKPHETAVS